MGLWLSLLWRHRRSDREVGRAALTAARPASSLCPLPSPLLNERSPDAFPDQQTTTGCARSSLV